MVSEDRSPTLVVTTVSAWSSPPVLLDHDAVAATDEPAALRAADTLARTEPAVVLTVPADHSPAASIGPDDVVEVRYARRDPAGRHAALLRRPATAEALDLLPHPEGGWYRETWRTAARFTPPGYPGARAAATAVLFLLQPGEHSMWHRVRSDELWLWHRGGPLELRFGGEAAHPEPTSTLTLGPDLSAGQSVQALVPGGHWQAAEPVAAEVLVSCVVAPGFDFADFRAATP